MSNVTNYQADGMAVVTEGPNGELVIEGLGNLLFVTVLEGAGLVMYRYTPATGWQPFIDMRSEAKTEGH